MTKYQQLLKPVADRYGLTLPPESAEAKAARLEAATKVRTFIDQLRAARRNGTVLGLLKPSYAAYMEKAEHGAVKQLHRLAEENK